MGNDCSNGSDERMYVSQWFDRCFFEFPINTLLQWLSTEMNIEYFVDLLNNIEAGYRDLEDSKIHPEFYDIEEIREDIKDCEEELQGYKSRYMKKYPNSDWEEEIQSVKKWYEETENFKNE